jgi:hypothetical protein
LQVTFRFEPLELPFGHVGSFWASYRENEKPICLRCET